MFRLRLSGCQANRPSPLAKSEFQVNTQSEVPSPGTIIFFPTYHPINDGPRMLPTAHTKRDLGRAIRE